MRNPTDPALPDPISLILASHGTDARTCGTGIGIDTRSSKQPNTPTPKHQHESHLTTARVRTRSRPTTVPFTRQTPDAALPHPPNAPRPPRSHPHMRTCDSRRRSRFPQKVAGFPQRGRSIPRSRAPPENITPGPRQRQPSLPIGSDPHAHDHTGDRGHHLGETERPPHVSSLTMC